MPTIQFGNTAVLEPYKEDEGVDDFKLRDRKDLGNRVTTVSIPPGWNDEEILTTAKRLWENASKESPAWVECDDDLIQRSLARHYNCPEKRPKNWKEG